MKKTFAQIKVGERFVLDGGVNVMKKLGDTEALVLADNLNITTSVDPAATTTTELIHADLVETIRKAAEDYIREQNVDELIEARFRHLEFLNRVMEVSVLALAENHEKFCRMVLDGILRMVVSINVELLECAENSPRRRELEKIIDERLSNVGDAESELFVEIRDKKPELFEKINLMVMDALDSMDFDPENYSAVASADRLAMYRFDERGAGSLHGLEIFEYEGGFRIASFDDGLKVVEMTVYNDGSIQLPTAKESVVSTSSSLPILGAAAFLAAAFALKVKAGKLEKSKIKQTVGVHV